MDDEKCVGDMRASGCEAGDGECLVQECETNERCQKAMKNCNIFGSGEVDEPENGDEGEEDDSGGEGEEPKDEDEEEPEEEEEQPEVDEDSSEYKACISNMGASDCPAADAQRIVDQCNEDEDCRAANLDCGVYA